MRVWESAISSLCDSIYNEKVCIIHITVKGKTNLLT